MTAEVSEHVDQVAAQHAVAAAASHMTPFPPKSHADCVLSPGEHAHR
ncbi:hypothetical protein [Streptomyces pseudogriseolus]